MMKKLFTVCVLGLTIAAYAPAGADLISFVTDPGFSGVDDTSHFSMGDTAVDVGTSSLSLLGGLGQVTAYYDGHLATLTHRGTRGLGVLGGEFDEVDSLNGLERIEITFDIPAYIGYLEVRSLFTNDPDTEEGEVKFYLAGAEVYTEHLVGLEAAPQDGSVAKDYSASPILADELIFFVPQGQKYTGMSEFAVAKLDASPVPEASTLLLFGSGLSGLMFIVRRKGWIKV